ncbi:prepilin peptidase [Candidatus Woesearchaeota archaeon]|nr:prepilin peptidase [Candidatus Woesearchaeota archaeon]
MIDILLVCIGLIALIAGTYTDIKILEVPDYLNFSVLVAAFGLRFIYSASTSEWMFLLNGLIGFGIFFIFGELMYYTKQWGGGDAKMLRSLGVLFATYPEFLLNYFSPALNFYFPVVLLLNILIVGAAYGLIFSLVFVFKNWRSFKKEYGKLISRKNVKLINRSVIVVSVAMLIAAFFMPFLYKIFLIAIAVIIFGFMQLGLFANACEKSCMIRKVSTHKLREGDWILDEVRKGKKILYKPKAFGATNKEIKALIKNKIRTVVIKQGIPFVPAMLIGVLLTLILGNFILLPFG